MGKILSAKGVELVNYKRQFDEVKNNELLQEALIELAKKKFLEKEVVLIKGVSNAKELENKLLQMPDYLKKEEEILKEKIEDFEEEVIKFGENIKKCMKSWEEDIKLYYTTEGNFEKNTITVTRKFGLGEKFLKDYFGVTDKRTLKRLMEKNGFLYEYAQLRIATVLSKMVRAVKVECDDMEISISKGYFSEKQQTYNVDFIVTVDNKDNVTEKAKYVRTLLCAIEDRFSLTEF